jgi:hypothetical protein
LERINEVVKVNETISGVSEGISATDAITNSLFKINLTGFKKHYI